MASTILACTKAADGYKVLVHLDTSQVDEGGGPSPESVHEWTWGLPQPSALPLLENGGHEESGAFLHAAHTQHGRDLTEQEYLENIFAMLPEMIELELHRRRASSHHDRDRTPVPALHGREIRSWQ